MIDLILFIAWLYCLHALAWELLVSNWEGVPIISNAQPQLIKCQIQRGNAINWAVLILIYINQSTVRRKFKIVGNLNIFCFKLFYKISSKRLYSWNVD